jgi:hypothetical protein
MTGLTVEELEAKYAAVMNNPVITNLMSYVPVEIPTEIDLDKIMERTKHFSGEMLEIINTLNRSNNE